MKFGTPAPIPHLTCVIRRRCAFCSSLAMKPTEDELAQVELGISDLERRIVETSSRLAHEAGAFGSFQVLHFMEQTLEELGGICGNG
jgi:hypothetical protein